MPNDAPKTALVTGVSTGIGHGLAAELLARGCRVFGFSRRSPKELSSQPEFRFAALDLTDSAAVRREIPLLLETASGLDLVVLNAGALGRVGDMAEMPVEDQKKVMDVNLWANVELLNALFALGKPVRQVVGMSSGASVSGNRGWNAYCLSKAALNVLMKLYAHERPQTHFAAFAPGTIETAMQHYVWALPDDPRFPTIQRLKAGRGTPSMPDPNTAAPRLLAAFEKLRALPSGEFSDVRRMD